MRRRVLLIAAAAFIVVATAACDGDDKQQSREEAAPSLLPTACPPEVENVLMSGYTCAYLTVPAAPGSQRGAVRLLVTTVEPSGGATHDDPLIGIGPDLATTFNYAGLAPAADRTGRTLILLNPRGVSGSEPDLDCPETESGGADAWLSSVDACADRLVAEGIDLGAFTPSAMASDVVALTQALGLDEWNLGSWGTSGRVALEVMRTDPPGLRSVFLDSPELPSDDPLTTAAVDTRGALARVLEDCAADRTCRSLPHSLADVERIVGELDRNPLVRSVTVEGGRTRVMVDGDLAVRLLRHMVSTGSSVSQYFTAGAVPAVLDALDRGASSLDDTVLAPMAASRPNCEGYLPSCQSFHRLSIGAFLSAVCPDAKAAEPPAASDAIGRTYADSPYLEACADWPVDAEALPDDPVTTDVPVLAVVGRYNPYLDVDRLRAGLHGLSHLQLLEVPAWGYNALSAGECLGGIRNAFVDGPEDDLKEGCLDGLPRRADFLPRL